MIWIFLFLEVIIMEGNVRLQLNIVDENGCELTEQGPHLFHTTDGVRYVGKYRNFMTTFRGLVELEHSTSSSSICMSSYTRL